MIKGLNNTGDRFEAKSLLVDRCQDLSLLELMKELWLTGSVF